MPRQQPDRPTAALLLTLAAHSDGKAAPLPTAAKRQRHTFAVILVSVIWIALTGGALFYQATHLHDVPIGKAWLLVGPDVKGGGVIPWVLRSGEPDSGPLTRLALAGLLRVRHDFRFGALLSLVLLAATSVCLIVAAARARGRVIIPDILFPLLLINPGATAVLSSGWRLTETVPAVFICLILLGLIAKPRNGWIAHPLMVSTGIGLLGLTGGVGPLIAAAMAGWLLTVALRGERGGWIRWLVGIAASATLVIVFRSRVLGPPRLTDLGLDWGAALRAIGSGIGSPGPGAGTVLGCGIIALVVITIGIGLRRGGAPRGLFILLGATVIATALHGAGAGKPESGVSSLAAGATLAGVYLYWSLSGPDATRTVSQLGLAGVAALLLPADFMARNQAANEYWFGMAQVLGDLERLAPPTIGAFVGQHREFLAPGLDSTALVEKIERLGRRHPAFSRLVGDSADRPPRTPRIVPWPPDAPASNVVISYTAPGAAEIALGWGINGWEAVPEIRRPRGTTVWTSMVSPMHRDGDRFAVSVAVPLNASIEYGFIISETDNGPLSESIWDGDYATSSGAGQSHQSASPQILARLHPSRDTTATGTFAVRLPGAGEAEMVWTTPDRAPSVARSWAQRTFAEADGLVTLLERHGDVFTAAIRTPVGTRLTYRFRATKSRRGNPVIAAWDSAGSHVATLDRDQTLLHDGLVTTEDAERASFAAVPAAIALCLLAAALGLIGLRTAGAARLATLQS